MLQTKSKSKYILIMYLLYLDVGLLGVLEVLDSLLKDRVDLKVQGKLKFVILWGFEVILEYKIGDELSNEVSKVSK